LANRKLGPGNKKTLPKAPKGLGRKKRAKKGGGGAAHIFWGREKKPPFIKKGGGGTTHFFQSFGGGGTALSPQHRGGLSPCGEKKNYLYERPLITIIIHTRAPLLGGWW